MMSKREIDVAQRAAREAKRALDALGGEEGLRKVQADARRLQALATDPKLRKALARAQAFTVDPKLQRTLASASKISAEQIAHLRVDPKLSQTIQQAAEAYAPLARSLQEAASQMQVAYSQLEAARADARANLKERSARVVHAKELLNESILDAHHIGLSLREIAQATGLSHESVRRVVASEKSDQNGEGGR